MAPGPEAPGPVRRARPVLRVRRYPRVLADPAGELREGRAAPGTPGEGAAHARLGRLRRQRRCRAGGRVHGREGRVLPGARADGQGDGEGRAEDSQPDRAGHRARHRPEGARRADAAHQGVRRHGRGPRTEAPPVRDVDAQVQRVPLAAGTRPRRALLAGGTGRICRGGRHGGGEGAEERHAVRAAAARAARREPETPRGRHGSRATAPRRERACARPRDRPQGRQVGVPRHARRGEARR